MRDLNWRLKKAAALWLCVCVDELGGAGGCGGGVLQTRGKTEYRSRDVACRWACRHGPSVRLWAQQGMSRRSTLYQSNPLKWLSWVGCFGFRAWLTTQNKEQALKYSPDGFLLLLCTHSYLYSLIARCPPTTNAGYQEGMRNGFELCFHRSPSVSVNL